MISSLNFLKFSLLISFGIIGSTLFLSGQTDSLGLKMNVLGKDDVETNIITIGNQQVVSASRSLKTVDELPFTIYVVTAEEIYKNGYTTLVDVLKTVPGIKVSQPGSGIDGETFLMRGLFGNSYTKILINDQPISPSVVNSMPIGAQLPIRQAERIEIIFGPAAAVYGADAAGGVINIILKETERPVYVRADLGVGDNGYRDINILFGGKIWKGKNTLRFSFYGSTTVFEDREVRYQQSTLYSPLLYALQPDAQNPNNLRVDTSYLSNENYRGSLTTPQLGELPHLSRMFGFDLKYRSFNFSYTSMYRRDHSTLGLNPYAVSSLNPLNYFGETINRFNFGINKDYRYFGIKLNLTGLLYELDNRSSYTYVHNSLWRFLDVSLLQPAPNPVIRDSIRSRIFNRYFSGQRFSAAKSADFFAELVLPIYPIKQLELVLGGRLEGSANDPLINYLRRPLELELDQNSDLIDQTGDIPINPPDTLYGTAGVFAQMYLDLNWVNLIGGIRFDYHSIYGESMNPRAAILFNPLKWMSLRGTYATAFRVPTPFYTANTFSILQSNPSSISTGTQELVPEETESFEVGGRFKLGKIFYADISYYRTETENFISYNFDPNFTVDPTVDRIELGYFNDANSKVTVEGMQARFVIKNILPRLKFRAEYNLNIARGSEVLPFDRGTLDRVRMQPNTISQLNVSFKPGRTLYFNFRNTFVSDWISRNIYSSDLTTTPEIPGYYNLDFMARLEVSDNFQVYLKINNLLNKEYGGIGATGFVDDLAFNPQPIRFLLFGLSYSMD